jgi:hypothetical protein
LEVTIRLIEIKTVNNFMTDEKTIAWIFLSTALATGIDPTDTRGISMIADGINHAIPTQKELQTSFSWLTKHGLVAKQEGKYSLTSEGKIIFGNASKDSKILFAIWENLEKLIKNYA